MMALSAATDRHESSQCRRLRLVCRYSLGGGWGARGPRNTPISLSTYRARLEATDNGHACIRRYRAHMRGSTKGHCPGKTGTPVGQPSLLQEDPTHPGTEEDLPSPGRPPYLCPLISALMTCPCRQVPMYEVHMYCSLPRGTHGCFVPTCLGASGPILYMYIHPRYHLRSP